MALVFANISSPAKAAAEVGSAKIPSSSAKACCIFKMLASSAATAEPPVNLSIFNICHCLDGAAMDMPPAIVFTAWSEDQFTPLKADTSGITFRDWTQCSLGMLSIRPDSLSSLNPL